GQSTLGSFGLVEYLRLRLASLSSAVCVACPLMRRYVYLYFSGLKFLRSMFFVPLAVRPSYFSKSALSAQVHE
uniref:hypothetical protein n=1 Tax=Vibrio fujianensis TaxID=1974215 RepID=UPI001C12A2D3